MSYRAVKNLDRRLDRLENQFEIRYHDSHNEGSISLADEAPNILNGIEDGDDNDNRDGAKYHVTSIRVKGFIASNAALVRSSFVRLIIFWFTNPDGQIPQVYSSAAEDVDSLLVNPTGYVGPPTHAPYNHESVVLARQFKIVYDKVYTFNPGQTFIAANDEGTSTVTQVAPIWKSIDLKINTTRDVVMQGNTGNAAGFIKNSLWMAWISSETGANFVPTRNVVTRVHFKDY